MPTLARTRSGGVPSPNRGVSSTETQRQALYLGVLAMALLVFQGG